MKVLVATDGSDFSRDAIREAMRYLHPENTRFRVLSCWELPEEIAVTTYDIAVEYYQKSQEAVELRANSDADRSENQIRRFYADEPVNIEKVVASGPPDKLIIEEARKWGADLIVVGTHGRGFWGRLLGSVSTGVLHHAPCAVFVGRKKEKAR